MKAFAELNPLELHDACFRATVRQLTPDNIIETAINCEKLIAQMPRVKWAEPIFALIGRLIDESVNFISANYHLVIGSGAFIQLGEVGSDKKIFLNEYISI